MLLVSSQKTKIISDHSSEYAFKILLESFAEELHFLGFKVNPYTESALARFQKFDIDVQKRIFSNFSKYYDLLSVLQASKVDLNNNRMLLWNALKHLGYKPCFDLLDYIDQEDVVEVYNSEFLQIFRNFKFMELCSYSVLDTFSHSWSELFLRPKAVDASLGAVGFQIFSNNVKSTMSVGVEDHYLFELFSEDMHYFKIHQKYASPIFGDNNAVGGVVATLGAQFLGANYNKENFLVKMVESYR